jgi:hypothetical protein
MLVIFSKVKLLPTLPVIFVVDKVNELPVDTKKLALTVGEITYNFIGAAPVLVNLPYLKLPVENVPAPGFAEKFATPVVEPDGRLILLLSAKFISSIDWVIEEPTLVPFNTRVSVIFTLRVAISFIYKY